MKSFATAVILIFSALWSHLALAQDTDEVVIEVTEVADNIYMLKGRGGNIGVSAGSDGVFLIDDQYAPLTDKIIDAIKTISDQPIKFVLNTHWHGDHTGGNENLGKQGVIIVAHDNVRTRMRVDNFIEFFKMDAPASPDIALPSITFNDSATFHINDETIRVKHVAHAHTDGDSYVYFEQANVMHAGDIFFNGSYPFIDASSGGKIRGVIAAVAEILALVNDDTKIIPGHGDLTDKKGLQNYHDMLLGIANNVEKLVKQGKTTEQIIAANPTKKFDGSWGQGFIGADKFIPLVIDSL